MYGHKRQEPKYTTGGKPGQKGVLLFRDIKKKCQRGRKMLIVSYAVLCKKRDVTQSLVGTHKA